MKIELHARLSQAQTPHALSEALYKCCSPEGEIERIDFLCSRRTANLGMTCFIGTQSQDTAHKLANRLEARVFGDKHVFFEVPLGHDFVCERPSLAGGGWGLPLSLSCKCSW